MNRIIPPLRQLIWHLLPVLLLWLLVACTPTQEPAQTAVSLPTITHTNLPTPTLLPTATPELPTAVPSLTPTPLPPPPQPSPTTQPLIGDNMPTSNTVQFNIVRQLGGVPQAVTVSNNIIAAGFGPRLFLIDADNMQVLGRSDVLPDAVKGIALQGTIAYVGNGRSGVAVLDISNPAEIITRGHFSQSLSNAGAVTLFGSSAFVEIVNQSGETTQLVRLDVSRPQQPVFAEQLNVPRGSHVSFTNGLVFLVGNGRITIYDAMQLNTPLSETPLSGGEFANHFFVQFPYLFVTQSGQQSGIEVFDVSDPAQITAVSDFNPISFFILDQTVGNAHTMFIAGTFGEFGYCGTQIHTINIADPTQPSTIGNFDPKNCITDMVLAENTLYLTGRSGLKVYDVQDPASPQLLTHFRHPDGFHDTQGIARADNLTYLLSIEGRQAELNIIDTANSAAGPTGPSIQFDTTTILDLHKNGRLLMAPLWNGGVNLFDITRPAAPQLLHGASQEGDLNSDFFAFAWTEEVVYLPVGIMGSIAAVDIRDPQSVVKTAVLEIGDHGISWLEVHENTLFALSQDGNTTLNIIDISNPFHPILTMRLPLESAPTKLAIIDSTLYLFCDGWSCNDVTLFDITQPSAPTAIKTFNLPLAVWDTVVDENQKLVYLLTYEDGIWAMDSQDPYNPVLAGHFTIPRGTTRLLPEANRLWLAGNNMGLYELEITQDVSSTN